MPPLKLTFDIPAHIVEGLVNGTLERVGGVVRDASTKQVVMWLRDTATNTISSGGIPSFDPVTGVLNLVMKAVNTGISINGFKAVNQRLDLMQGILTVTSAASILNLGVSVIGFALILQRLKEIEKNLQKNQELLTKIDQKIDLSFYANFRAALDLADHAFTMSKEENRRSSALNAINRFLEAQHIYLDYADKELEKDDRSIRPQIVKDYLSTLCLAYIAESRCYLELEEFETAAKRFREAKKQIHTRIGKYVDALLSSNPSIYLHPSLKEEIDLTRLTKIYQWKNPELNENSVFDLVRDNINWKELNINNLGVLVAAALPDLNLFNAIKSLPLISEPKIVTKFKEERDRIDAIIKKLLFFMSEMESLIETDRRFEGYEIEVKALSKLGINFYEWLNLQPEESISQNTGIIYIVPDEPLDLSE
jgi:hypothetical protein